MQWNETDLAYLRRRLEEDGLAFWHKHQAGQHTLVVTDGTLAYTDGPGLLDVNFSPKDRPLPAPQIEADAEPIYDWRQDPAPQGFAPIPPWWRWRQRHVGTIDDVWIDERHPILPKDFDYRFY